MTDVSHDIVLGDCRGQGKPKKFESVLVDPDDEPEWADDALARAELAVGGKVIEPAEGIFKRSRAENSAED